MEAICLEAAIKLAKTAGASLGPAGWEADEVYASCISTAPVSEAKEAEWITLWTPAHSFSSIFGSLVLQLVLLQAARKMGAELDMTVRWVYRSTPAVKKA